MTEGTIEVHVNPRSVSTLVIGMRGIDGVAVRIPTQDLERPTPSQGHAAASISFDQLVPLLVTVTGAATALLSLATALIQHRDVKRREHAQEGQHDSHAINVVIDNRVLQVSQFTDAKALATQIASCLRSRETGRLDESPNKSIEGDE